MNTDIADTTAKEELSRVGKNTLIYGVGNVLSKAVSFLLIPLYTHHLSTYEVGIIVLLEVLEVLYIYIAPMGMITALWRYFHIEKKARAEKKLISGSWLFIMGSNAALLLTLIFASRFIAGLYLSDPGYSGLVALFCVCIYLGVSRLFFLSLMRIYERALLFIVIVFADFVLTIFLTIWFIIGLNLGLWGVVYAKLISSSLIFFVTIIFILKSYGLHYDQSTITRSLRYGFPLIFHGISLLILSMSDRFLIKQLISVETAGIYGIAYKFGMIMNMVLVTPFVQAWQPILFRLENHPEQRLTYQRMALHFVQIATFAWLGLSVFAKYLVMWTTTPEYHAGISIIPLIAFSYVLYGLQNIFNAGALIHNETMKMMAYGLITALVNVALNVVLIPKWGMMGAAAVTVVSYLILMLMIFQLSQSRFAVNWRWEKMLAIFAVGMICYFASLINLAGPLNYLKDVLAVMLFPILLIALKLLSFNETRRFVRGFKGL
jgi:O-antigen/teichoic acid export membrane protein